MAGSYRVFYKCARLELCRTISRYTCSNIFQVCSRTADYKPMVSLYTRRCQRKLFHLRAVCNRNCTRNNMMSECPHICVHIDSTQHERTRRRYNVPVHHCRRCSPTLCYIPVAGRCIDLTRNGIHLDLDMLYSCLWELKKRKIIIRYLIASLIVKSYM